MEKVLGEETLVMEEECFVLGVGLPRTGSVSLKLALEELLGGKCYHMWEICGPENIARTHDHAIFWNEALDGKRDARAIVNFLKSNGYNAALDLPVNCFWKELYQELWPNVKVILSEREPESWYNSVNSTINNSTNAKLYELPLNLMLFLSNSHEAHNLRLAERSKEFIKLGIKDKMSMDEARKYYESWVKNVKSVVEPSRLLVRKVDEDWDSLCSFLDKSRPQKAFPRLNDAQSLKSILEDYVRRQQNLLLAKSCLVTLTILLGLTSLFDVKNLL